MSTLKVNNIDAYSNNGAQGVRVRSSLIVGGVTGSGNQNQVYTGSNEDVYASLALGFGTDATGENSVALGSHTIASGEISLAHGAQTRAVGLASHAEGSYTRAEGIFSHAEGYFTKTTSTGKYAHAEGLVTTASRDYSHAEGQYTVADSAGQHAQGKYNATGSGAVMVIGNGTNAGFGRNNLAEFHTGSVGFVFDVNAIPTSSIGLTATGSIYRTGSNLDEIRIFLG